MWGACHMRVSEEDGKPVAPSALRLMRVWVVDEQGKGIWSIVRAADAGLPIFSRLLLITGEPALNTITPV